MAWRLDSDPMHYETWHISGYDTVQLKGGWAVAMANEMRRAQHRIVFQIGETPTVVFPAKGSNAAIANAMTACGLEVDPRYYGNKDAAEILDGLLDSIDERMID